jgi:hypothetical protein
MIHATARESLTTPPCPAPRRINVCFAYSRFGAVERHNSIADNARQCPRDTPNNKVTWYTRVGHQVLKGRKERMFRRKAVDAARSTSGKISQHLWSYKRFLFSSDLPIFCAPIAAQVNQSGTEASYPVDTCYAQLRPLAWAAVDELGQLPFSKRRVNRAIP